MSRPQTRYVESRDGFIGYQVFGAQTPDIVFITGWVTNVDMYWDEPSAIRYFDRLGSFGRVFLIDKRGSGVSDGPLRGYIDPVEDALDDIRTVLDAEESEEAVLIGDTEGGMLACILAATYPERFPTLILVNSYARMARADDYPIGAPPHVIESLAEGWKSSFGRTADPLDLTAPTAAKDPRFRTWWPWFQRQSMAPSVGQKAIDWIAETDVRSVLPSIQAQTLIVHRRHARYHRLPFGEYLADHIPGAELEIVSGADTFPFHAGDTSETLNAIETFVTGRSGSLQTNRMLATILFSDIVGSTSLASESGDDRWLDARAEHDRLVRLQLDRFQGKEVNTTGDGFVATFDGPMRAIQCAQVMVSELKKIGLDIRVGIHTGEIEVRDDDIGGLGVHIAARVMAAAESGGIMASSTVKDLVIGSSLEFNDCGAFELKGIPGSWNLFEVRAVL
ncbi:MAG TPA: adenylate/guanylate cyclase domain-containing protein [Acidimicrobiia bacterium]